MATTNKTKPTAVSVEGYIAAVPIETRRKDAEVLDALMRRVTKVEPRMWGPSMIGYGEMRYRSAATGREGDSFLAGFAPRRANLVLYLDTGFDGAADLLAALGKHKTSVACLYINKLADVDMRVLEKLVTRSFTHTKASAKDGVVTLQGSAGGL